MTLSSDGGGSVRIPASSCGVFGLKPTFGRVPNTGDTNLDGTVGHLGPIASTVDAMEAFLRTTAGPDGRCRLAARAPALDLDALTKSRTAGAAGLRVAVDEDAWADADPAVAAPCREALRALERAGATLHTASVPLGVHAPALGFITMISEAAEGHAEEYDRHRDVMALDVRMALALGRRMRAREYHHAQRLRQRLRAELAQVFASADLYVTPTTGCTAPPVRPGAEDTGEVDQFTTNKLVRYTFLGNLTGLPAGTAPVGRDAYGLPVGMQLMARAWDEPMVLRGLYALEALGAARVERPEVYFELDP
jgi:aspartyl-tRNA(Asn)/glutamyl-tRNA(Gln) amidotransferase subunit A